MKDASCKDCLKLKNGNPQFCTWLLAEIPVGLADDPECEGFAAKGLRTRQGERTDLQLEGNISLKSSTKQPRKPLTQQKETCPKTPDKNLIQTALELKKLKGSIVRERVRCGRVGCRCANGKLHGPYHYLHFYDHESGKVKRRYLGKALSLLLSHPTQQLEQMLLETGAALGQEKPIESEEK